MKLNANFPFFKQIITLSVVACLIWQLSILIWFVVPITSEASSVAGEVEKIAVAQSKQQSINMRQVAALNLFGLSAGVNRAKSPTIKQITAPETSLNLKLRGLRKGQGIIRSSAIIESSRGVQDIYYLGDNIQGHSQVKVHEIYSQRLILQRAGKFETLTLFEVLKQSKLPEAEVKSDPQKAVMPPKARTPIIDKTRSKKLTESLSSIVDTLKTSPLSLNGTMVIEPAEDNGEFQGYKVAPGRDKLLFARLGLVKGDVITQVNEVKLTSSGKVMSLMGILSSADELEVKVLRRGRPLAFRYKVK